MAELPKTAKPSAVLCGLLAAVVTGCGGGGSSGTPAPPSIAVTISVSPTTITLGQPATVTWSSTNATGCTASGEWSGARATSGNEIVTPQSAGSKMFTLSCTGPNGNASNSATLTVTTASSNSLTWDQGTWDTINWN